jgi:hypothetical protein
LRIIVCRDNIETYFVEKVWFMYQIVRGPDFKGTIVAYKLWLDAKNQNSLAELTGQVPSWTRSSSTGHGLKVLIKNGSRNSFVLKQGRLR